jgi:hypothetical protein
MSRGQGSYNRIKKSKKTLNSQKKVKEANTREKELANVPWEASVVSRILTHSSPRERNFCINICRRKQYEKEIKKQKESNT